MSTLYLVKTLRYVNRQLNLFGKHKLFLFMDSHQPNKHFPKISVNSTETLRLWST